MLLRGMSEIFERKKNFEIVAHGENADAAIDIASRLGPDVLVTDLSMPGDVFGAIRQISQQYSSIRVVVFTAFSGLDYLLKALDAGATGFVLKGGRIRDLTDSIDAVMRGEMYITKQYAGQVLGGLRSRETQDKLNIKLSTREKQIIGHLMQARTNREIAEAMQLSEKTIKHYMSRLMTKLNARNRIEVVFAAQQFRSLDG
jgi:DNA-binding NarL/FixJ family response regulator